MYRGLTLQFKAYASRPAKISAFYNSLTGATGFSK